MPPKQKITKDMIIDAAFSIVRKNGIDKVTARSISEQLKCSTQPVLYYFSSVEDIKKAVYEKADKYHTDQIMNIANAQGNPMLTIGLNYIKFAIRERNLFRLLFQSDEFAGTSLPELINAEELLPLLTVLQKQLGVSLNGAKEIFSTLFIFVHGYASMYANNQMIYDEEQLISALKKVFYGTVRAVKEE